MCLVGLAAVVFSEGQKVGEEEECRDGQLRPPHVEREDVAGWGAVASPMKKEAWMNIAI